MAIGAGVDSVSGLGISTPPGPVGVYALTVHGWMVGSGLVFVVMLGAGCSVGGQPSSGGESLSSAPPPSYVGQLGKPVQARATTGATADITLISVAWVSRCKGALPCVAVKLALVGTSRHSFQYNESYVSGCYATTPDPWARLENTDCPSADPMVNYEEINKLPPLRLGSVVMGQKADGYVAIPLGSRAKWYIKVNDPSGDEPEAAWVVDA